MFGLKPSFESLEKSATEAAAELEQAVAALAAAEQADTSEGTGATWKSLEQARQAHDRAVRRNTAAQAKYQAERARLATEELEARKAEFARLTAALRDHDARLAPELAEFTELDSKLAYLIERCEAKRVQYTRECERWFGLARELGHDVGGADSPTYSPFNAQSRVARALMLARKERRKDSFAKGENKHGAHRPDEWLVGAPEHTPVVVV